MRNCFVNSSQEALSIPDPKSKKTFFFFYSPSASPQMIENSELYQALEFTKWGGQETSSSEVGEALRFGREQR